ncbi:MAG: hypothetical protein KBT11_10970, partial [Treponema sp.]|nr:hypothetical protein [Candidatus Treponema equifaecale]
MNHFFKRVTALFLWIWCYSGWAFSQESYEFVNKDINEILYAVSLAKNFSIAADDTVWGNGDFRFVGEDFDEAFDAFLLKNRLYVQKSEKGWLVSKIRFRRILEKSEDYEKKTEYGNEAVTESEKIEESGILKFSLDACDVTPARLFECVSSETGRCITWDSLPSVKISVHTGNCTLDEMVEKIAEACGGYDCRSEKNGFHVSRAGIMENGGGNGRC